MASGPYFDKRRGTYTVQWFDGVKWTRATVFKVPGWRPGQALPKKVPLEATRGLTVYAEKEREARRRQGPIDPSRTVAGFLADYQGVYANENAAGSAGELAKAIKLFLPWCTEHRVIKLDEVTSSGCQRWLDARARTISRKTGKRISPARLNQERALLSGAWSRALRLQEVPSNPWTATVAPGWERRKKERHHRPSWSPEQFDQLLAVCRPWLRDVLILGTQTGFRISGLLGLEWRDVRWAKEGPHFGELELRPELDKVGKGYKVPMSRTAHDLLARRFVHRNADLTLILLGYQGKPTNLRATYKAIIAACQRADLPRPLSPNHHMRRSFGRWAVMGHLTGRPVPLYVVSKWMGHASVKMTEDYLDVHTDESQQWMAEFAPTSERHEGDPGLRKDSGGQ